jgi:hypothetical protein
MKKTLAFIALCATLQIPAVGAARAELGLDRQMRAEPSNSCEKKHFICRQDLGPTPRRTWQVSSCQNDYNRCVGR